VPVYRCDTGAGDHFESADPGCEGFTTEALLGYGLAYAHLIRHLSPSHPYDHTSAVTLVPADYLAEGRLGLAAITWQAGTTSLFSCRRAADAFLSTDAACEGATVVGHSGGRIWLAPPEDLPSHQLFRCRAATGETFESADPTCEGQTVDRSLGYLVTHL
jgi:hypothetical protein